MAHMQLRTDETELTVQGPPEDAGADVVVIDLRQPRHPAPATRDPTDSERQRLVDAAWVVLARSGWSGLKVDLVLHEAGLSTRSFYRHFDTKNALMVHLLESELDVATDHLRSRAGGRSDPPGQVVAWLNAFVGLGVHRSTVGRARLFIATWGSLDREFPQAVAGVRSRLVATLAEVIERGREAGCFPCAEPTADADHIFSLAVGRLIELRGASPAQLHEQMAGTHRFALRALGWPADA
jgi:AcrR family transcriptional regulator